jgi:hypothetical protein
MSTGDRRSTHAREQNTKGSGPRTGEPLRNVFITCGLLGGMAGRGGRGQRGAAGQWLYYCR